MRPVPNIRLHIERLVLHGLSPLDRDRVREAFTQELSRLLLEQGVPESLAGGAHVARLEVGTVRPHPGASGESVGVQAARAAYTRLAGGGEGR